MIECVKLIRKSIKLSNSAFWGWLSKESQPQNPEFKESWKSSKSWPLEILILQPEEFLQNIQNFQV